MSLTLHHYGFLTADTTAWLAENELLLGRPFRVFETVEITAQKVKITFVQQLENDVVFTELVEPAADNISLQKMLNKGVTVYHKGYLAAPGAFDALLTGFAEKEVHVLPAFHSEAFNGLRCAFVVTSGLGLIEIIESI